MRPLTRADRNRVFAALQEWSDRTKLANGSRRSEGARLVGLRTRALISLAADTGLRVQECVRLDLAQLVQDTGGRAVRIVSRFWLRPNQAKGGERGAGMIEVSERAQTALRLYVLELRRLQWAPWPAKPHTPLFVTHRGHRGKPGHHRLSKRAAQWSWHQIQRRAGLVDADGETVKARYGFHSLRHDAVTRLRGAGADVFDLQAQMRWRDIRHAQRYVEQVDAHRRLTGLVKKAAKG